MRRYTRALIAPALAAGLFIGTLAGAPMVGGAAPAAAALALAPAIAEATRADHARGVFYTRTLTFTVGASAVRLASTPDGAGELCTDDQASLTFRRPGARDQEWSRVFADPASGTVGCLPPQLLKLEAGPGTYEVEVVLTDQFPFTYSSRPYFLLVADEPSGSLSAVDDVAPPSAQASRHTPALSTPTSTPAMTPTESRVIAQAWPAPDEAPNGVPAAESAPAGVGAWPWPALHGALAAAVLALAIFVIAAGRRPRPRPRSLVGIVDLTDRATGETRTALLQHFPGGAAIVRGPLDLVAPSGSLNERVVATIVPSQAGPLLQLAADNTATSAPLREGEPLLIDRAVELRYRGTSPANRLPKPSRRL